MKYEYFFAVWTKKKKNTKKMKEMAWLEYLINKRLKLETIALMKKSTTISLLAD